MVPPLFDLHTHTFLSDGVLSPAEMLRRSQAVGYGAVALTDHVGAGNLESVVQALVRECELHQRYGGIIAIPGVELTHVPPESIPELASMAKRLGARLVLVHGETLVEPVLPGTNRIAVECPEVDILAHPGLIDEALARQAADRGLCLELTTRRGHSLTNGHVAVVARAAGARLLLNTDAHGPGDLVSHSFALGVLRGAGISAQDAGVILEENPQQLLAQLGD